jgi:hypothetical protein
MLKISHLLRLFLPFKLVDFTCMRVINIFKILGHVEDSLLVGV